MTKAELFKIVDEIVYGRTRREKMKAAVEEFIKSQHSSKPIVRSSAPKSKAKKKDEGESFFNSWDKVIKSL